MTSSLSPSPSRSAPAKITSPNDRVRPPNGPAGNGMTVSGACAGGSQQRQPDARRVAEEDPVGHVRPRGAGDPHDDRAARDEGGPRRRDRALEAGDELRVTFPQHRDGALTADRRVREDDELAPAVAVDIGRHDPVVAGDRPRCDVGLRQRVGRDQALLLDRPDDAGELRQGRGRAPSIRCRRRSSGGAGRAVDDVLGVDGEPGRARLDAVGCEPGDLTARRERVDRLPECLVVDGDQERRAGELVLETARQERHVGRAAVGAGERQDVACEVRRSGRLDPPPREPDPGGSSEQTSSK